MFNEQKVMKNILIIGSKGFIGNQLKIFLENKKFNVWGADVITDYTESDQYVVIDASNADYREIFETQQFDLCINCSGAASVPDSLQHPLRDYNLNTVNVFKLLEAIRTNQPTCKFINLSSAAVYGNPVKLPVSEVATVKPVSPYGYHKLMSEQICNEYYQFFGIPTCSVRIFSAYGEGLKKQLFWDLYQKTKSNKKIFLFGTGKESRDFIYISDLLNAIYVIALNTTFEGNVVNVANGEEIFIEDCVKIFYDFFEKKIPYEFSGKGRKGDPNNWVADISILKQLGYKQKYSINEGLYDYYTWVLKTERKLD